MRKRKHPWINPRVLSKPRAAILRRIESHRSEEQASIRIGPFTIGFGGALLVILILAAIVRFLGIDWGGAYYLHPDERYLTEVTVGVHWPGSLTAYFDSATSTLNPFNNPKYTSYVYGTFPLFLTKLLGALVGDTVYGNAHLPGRWLAALSDIGTIAAAAWIGKMLFGRVAGLFAAILLAFTALMIQAAHYYSTDSMATFFVTATFACSVAASQKRSWRFFALAGLSVGIAAACKPTAGLAAGFVVLPMLEQIRTQGWSSLWPRFSSTNPAKRFPIVAASMLAAFIALWTFRFAQPYAFLGPSPWSLRLDPRWTGTLEYWSKAQSGVLDYPPGIQWANRAPITFIVDNLVRWGMAPAFGLTVLVALAIAVWKIIFARKWPSWWLLGMTVWCGFHIVYYGTNFVKVQRYLIPAYPVMGILAGGALASLVFWAKRRGGIPLPQGKRLRFPRWLPKYLHPGYILPTVVVLVTVVYGVAFTNIYIQPLSRVAASDWIYDNVPAGSTLSSEYWDDSLPICTPGHDCGAYQGVQLHLYDDDNPAKLNSLIGDLNQIDYVILSSRRLIDSIDRMPYRWPMTTAYYDYLFDGQLGFDLVATFDSPPRIGPLRFDDRTSEESLTVYEHPSVYIFKKSDRWDAHTAYTLLDTALSTGLGNDTGLSLPAVALSPDAQLLSAGDITKYFSAGTWTNLFNPSDWANRWPVAFWYLALQLLTVPAIPLLWRLLPGLPDRGYAIAKTFGLVGVTYIAWMIASLRLMEFGPIPIAIGWLVLLALSALAIRGKVDPFLTHLNRRWLWIAMTEALFLAVFAIAVWMRAQNPDLWSQVSGGEKPIDLAYLSATIRTPYFPPYDPWFAGGTIHSAYWGLVPWAAITRLTGIVPTTAYNLAVPTIFTLLLVNCWSVAASLIARLVSPLATTPTRIRRTLRPMLLGLIAPIVVGILGNLQFIRLLGQGVWNTTPVPADWPALGGLSEFVWGMRNLFIALPALPTSIYLDSTRIIPGTVTEFPYFGFIFGDLQPQFTALPILTLFVALVVAFTFGTVSDETANETTARPAAVFVTLGGWKNALCFALVGGFLCGMLLASNPWYYPVALALLVGTAFVFSGTQSGWAAGWKLMRDVGMFAIAAIVVSQGVWQQYVAHSAPLSTKFDPVEDQTALADFLSINGLLLFAVASYLGLELARMIRAARSEGPTGKAGAWFGLVVGLGCFGVAFASGVSSLIPVLLLVIVVVVAWYRQYDRGHLLVLSIIALGLFLLIIPDWAQFTGDVGRADTLLTFSSLAGILLGIAGAVGIALVFDAIARRSLDETATPIPHADIEPVDQPTQRDPWNWVPRIVETGWSVILVILIVGAASYPALATSARFDDRMIPTAQTLNGLAYMDDATIVVPSADQGSVSFSLRGDREAVDWLNLHTIGMPIILEAHSGENQWGGRISAMTGLPTLLGWSARERSQRPGFEPLIANRENDIQTIFGSLGSFASITPLLDRYGVQLIYVGDLERATYGRAALTKFDEGVTEGSLTVVYQQDGVTIYLYQSAPPASPELAPLEEVIASPAASPEASPQASPSASPVAPPEASSVAATPQASPGASPVASPQASPSASPDTPTVVMERP